MGTDWFLKKGSSHKVCEDYVICGNDYLILSDGCSQSPFTDVGSRVLCMAAAGGINTLMKRGILPDYEVFGMTVARQAASIIRTMNLPKESLNATLLIAWKMGPMVHTFVYGDGHVYCEYEGENGEQSIHLYSYEYGDPENPETNAPLYLSYWLEQKDLDTYRDNFGENNLTVKFNGSPRDKEVNGKFDHLIFPSLWKNIAIFSDGVESFTKPGVEKLDHVEVIEELTSFKNYNGEFIRRRANGAFRYYNKEGIIHTDDLSVAGLHNDFETSED